MTEATKKKAPSRPTKDISRAARPEHRVPIHGMRDKLTVRGKNPDFEYRWVRDTNEDGARIFEFHNAGWDFVQSDSGVQIGQSLVYKTENVGSIIRVPSGDGEYMYLMFIPKELYDADQAEKAYAIDELERQIIEPQEDDGQYGRNKLDFKIGKIGEDENLR